MATPKTTSDIRFTDNWLTVQMSLTGANNFSDTLPLDDVGGGGAGPHLVMDRGIWKYPQQAAGGSLVIPRNVGRPVRLSNVMADFGASVTYSIHIAGIDGTALGPDNTTNEPYAAADAALYREGDIIVNTGTTRYLALNLDPVDAGESSLLHPGQRVYVVTALAAAPLIRFTFNLAVENIG